MTLADLIKPGPALEADGELTIYEIETGNVVYQFEGLEILNRLKSLEELRQERGKLKGLIVTWRNLAEGDCEIAADGLEKA